MALFPVESGEWPEWFKDAFEASPRMRALSKGALFRLVRELDYAVKSGACFRASGVFPCSGVHKVKR